MMEGWKYLISNFHKATNYLYNDQSQTKKKKAKIYTSASNYVNQVEKTIRHT